jgi:hypothetical protein
LRCTTDIIWLAVVIGPGLVPLAEWLPETESGQQRGPAFNDERPRQIIGVVGDVRDGGLNREPGQTYMYFRARLPMAKMPRYLRLSRGPGWCEPGCRLLSLSFPIPGTGATRAEDCRSRTSAPWKKPIAISPPPKTSTCWY